MTVFLPYIFYGWRKTTLMNAVVAPTFVVVTRAPLLLIICSVSGAVKSTITVFVIKWLARVLVVPPAIAPPLFSKENKRSLELELKPQVTR
jgi:hypothetical protein